MGTSVGFVGLGNMGWPMAHNLVEGGFDLVVRDADPDLQQRFADEHGCAAATTAADFASCEAVVTMLPNDKIVRRAIVDWDGGIAPHMPDGAIVIDMSSSNPDGTRSLGATLAEDGVTLVDAPVSGGVARAETGDLSLMVGGDDDAAIERAIPVLEKLGSRIFRTGPLGSGHAMKALNNVLAATAYAAAAEALVIGKEYGLLPETMIEIINTATGRSFSSEVVFADHVVTGAYATGFALELLAKDAGIAATLADGLDGVDTPVVRLVADRWAAAAASAEPGVDHSRAHEEWFDADEFPAVSPTTSAEAH
jgi:3-hydroxyisobutyrate dehydrogenase